ncbi:MerR family transcriptional regulator [Roseibium limicola]|uniref:MerR family DNA-binding transcriptional regulator n=1 Tax=Roseibium limicola TaxID=2816037 RepID=A0A939J9I4_9HYPH|nr:MerR family DNA-binding transcriptional regulator [Roseibium limicola]MBO0345428.1 MerR family DNA-binding transcriptional regulator [Roseibium limicola]
MSEALSILNESDLADSLDPRDEGSKKPFFTIGELAKEFECTLRTLRFYEDKGLINPKRDGMNRVYSRRDRARLKLVLMGKRVGFSLAEIRDMLDLYDLRDGQVTQLRVALNRFNEQIDVLEKQRTDIEQAIGELSRTVSVVSGMLRQKETEEAETNELMNAASSLD